MEIYLIRHTPTLASKGLCYGHTDVELAEPFIPKFESIQKTLNHTNFEIYSSPLVRCKKLADYLSNGNNVIVSNSLMEINFGDWENQLWNTIPYEVTQSWMNDFVNIAPPNGESLTDLYERINDFIEYELINKEHPNPIYVVTHAGVIRCFICYILNIPLANAFKIQIDFSSISKINLFKNKDYNLLSYLNKEAQLTKTTTDRL